MRKYLVLFAICFYSFISNAQNVGIGVPNPQNKLHVGGGFRLDTLTGVGGAGLVRHDANGVVYGIKFSGNTNDVLRGDGSFGAFNINGAIGWLLNGNSGTNSVTNFIGTSDDASLVFKIRNLRSGIIDSAQANSSFGYRTLSQNTTGSGNNAFGFKSLFSNTTGARNTAVGNEALSKNDVGNDNTAVGFNALSQNRYLSFGGNANTAMGSGALSSNVNGTSNTANGFNALKMNLYTSENCAFGISALENNTAYQNNAFGAFALFANTTGSQNSAFGHHALSSNTTGYDNTAFGWYSLLKNNSYFNSAFGNYSLFNNTSGHDNTAIGYSSMIENSTGAFNTSIGAFAMTKNGGSNVAVGYKAMEIGNGFQNTGIGNFALHGNGGQSNTAVGYLALPSAGLGNSNVAIGARSLYSNSWGTGNIGIGFSAGSTNINGHDLTIIGSYANVAVDNLTSATALGYGAFVNASNKVRLGASGTTVSASAYIIESDGRFKDRINDNDVPGLSFILKLHPVAYNFNYQQFDNFLRKNLVEETDHSKKASHEKYLAEVSKKREIGFVAQDIEKLIKEKGYTFNGLYAPQNENDNYGLDYSKFVVPLVKAIQEQQAIIEKQQKQLDDLIKRIEALEKK